MLFNDYYCDDQKQWGIRPLCELVDITAFVQFNYWFDCPSLNTSSEAVFSMGIFNKRIECAMKARQIGPVLTVWSYNGITGECFASFNTRETLLEQTGL